jgi:hypothetical protein
LQNERGILSGLFFTPPAIVERFFETIRYPAVRARILKVAIAGIRWVDRDAMRHLADDGS